MRGMLTASALPYLESCKQKKSEDEKSYMAERRSSGAAGYAVTIGINEVNASHYAQWYGKLNAAESDADAMQRLLTASGFTPEPALRAKQANRANVIASIKRLAAKATAGDLVCVFYAGHGGTVYDSSRDEMRNRDQTWCLYDAQLIDDEIYNLCTNFAAGTRVLFISDSCKSGSMLMEMVLDNALGLEERVGAPVSNDLANVEVRKKYIDTLSRSMPDSVAMATRMQNSKYYDEVVINARASTATLQTRCELLAASNEMQDAYEDKQHGYFTGALLKTCGTACSQTYVQLMNAIKQEVGRKSFQSPTRFSIGPSATWFEDEVALLI